jgi:hypothetical protein
MALIKIANATGKVLDYIIAQAFESSPEFCWEVQDGVALGHDVGDPEILLYIRDGSVWDSYKYRDRYPQAERYRPSFDNEQGWNLIEREGKTLSVLYWPDSETHWACVADSRDEETIGYEGPTRLIACLRALAIAKVGEEFEVPDGLLS